MPVIQTVNIISDLAAEYGLQYTKALVQAQVPSTKSNPYDGAINPDPFYESDIEFIVGTSALGTPVFTNIVFAGGTYIDPLTKTPYTFANIELQTVLLTVSQAKKIVKTEIQGRNGTVKEYIGMDDYHITINAIINGANYTYPWDQVTAIKKMLDAPVALNVICYYLNSLGVHSLIVEGYQLGQEQGMYSQQKITINCLSDTPLLLQPNGQ